MEGTEPRLAVEAALLRRVTELANMGMDATAALTGAVRDIRETLGLRAGHLLVDHGEGLADADYWSIDDSSDPAEVRPELGEPHLIVPVTADGQTVAAMEFFADGPIEVDDELGRLLENVGRQLGLVVTRQRILDELEASRQELERSNAELERFAYVASHDLQEPLRKIVGFAELLERHHEPADEEEAEYLGYLVDAARRMQRLIKDLLAYSRAGRREVAPVDVDLNAVLENVLDDLSMQVAEAEAVVDVGDLPVVRGDTGQLREAVMNLVANSLKYRDLARPPVIGVHEVACEEEGQVEVVIEDNGMGIPTEHREAVFQVFRRLHPAHLYDGTGLGLALVRVIVERHGGRVWFDAGEHGEGSRAHVRLPRGGHGHGQTS